MLRKVNFTLVVINLIVFFSLVSGICYSGDTGDYSQQIASLSAKVQNLDARVKALESKPVGSSVSGGAWSTPDGKIVDQPKDSTKVSISSSGKVHWWCNSFNPFSELTWKEAKEQGSSTANYCLLCVKHLVPPGASEVKK